MGVTYAPRWRLAGDGRGERADGQGRKPALVLWSIPPSPDLLRWLLDVARPEEVYLCGRYTADDAMSAVLRAVAGMCKHVLNPQQQAQGGAPVSLLDINRAAAKLGTTEAVLRHALLWLEARGDIYLIEWQAGDTVRIAPGDGQPRRAEMRQIESEIEEMLAEVRAWRRYFQRARLADLNLRAGEGA
jgi:hypothetical protein